MNGRIKSLDAMRGLAILGVILIHTTTRTLEASHFNLNSFSWSLFLNQSMRFAVPLFFIISGFVLEISFKSEGFWSFIKRRFSKIFIPYVLWSLFYYYFVYASNDDSLVKVFLTGNASYQLYFIPALLIFYLTFPLIRKLVHRFSNKIILVLTVFVGLVLLFKNYYIKAFDLGDEINAMILSYSYFIIGILSAKNRAVLDKIANKLKLFLAIPAVFLAVIVFWEGKSRYLLTENYLSFYSSWRPSVFFYTAAIALLIYYIFEHTKLNGSYISRFAKHSLFVFFIHVAVLEIVWKYFGQYAFSLTDGAIGRFVFDPVFFVVVTLISFLLAKLVHKIPKLMQFLG